MGENLSESKQYQPSEAQIGQLTAVFSFAFQSPANADQAQRCEEIRETLADFAARLTALCPPSRELAMALTKLEEAMTWAVASIVRNE